MKIRNGFVSNSSSSSFIISDENFPSVRSLATYMIKQKISEYDNSYDKEYIKINKKYIKNLNKIDEDQSVSFPSCNYDTYIRKVGDCYLVATCNNHMWDLYDYSTSLTENAKDALNNLLNKYEGTRDYDTILNILSGDRHEFHSFGVDFYDLDKNVIGIESWDECPKCGEHFWHTPKHGRICISCNPYFQRKEKLKRINNGG